MRLLFDTHAVFWSLIEPVRLSPLVTATLRDEHLFFVSVASLWEMAIKVGAGKWPEAAGLVQRFEAETASAGFTILPITIEHARHAGLMSTPHRDPFDRLLVAQAVRENLTLVTSDSKLAGLGAPCLW